MIVNETLDFIKQHHKNIFETATIEKTVVGLFFTAVKLSSGFCGLVKTEIDPVWGTSNYREKDLSSFSPGNIKGQKAVDLFNYNGPSIPVEIIKLAVLNAISAEITAHSNHYIIEDKDPIDLIDLTGSKTICIVGAFQSYIKKLAPTSNKLLVVELNENALSDEHKKYFVPSLQVASAFSQSDIVVITASSIANNTIDGLLKIIPPQKQIIVVGPSGSILPEILFKYNVSIIGATRVIDAEKMFEVISEAGAGYHLFAKTCAKKICVINEQKKTNK